MYYIGIDLGTSSVKLLLLSDDNTVVETVTKQYPISYPKDGWAEQNPDDWYEQTIAGIHQLTANIDTSEIAGISFAGQMHGLVILDREDHVIRPCILWNDGRTIEECNYLNEQIGTTQLSSYTANIAFAGFTAPKLLWLKKHEPDNFAKISKIMLPKDYLAYRLTGVFSTDVSDASGTLLFDVKNRCWSKEMCDLCMVSADMLPNVFESYEKIGTLTKPVARLLHFPEHVVVAAGAGDNAGAAVSTGTLGEGNCNISLGTSGTIFISSKHFCVDPFNALHSFCNSDGNYHLMGCILSAASCNQWWSDNILHTTDYETEQSHISKLGQNTVYFLPYLMGERSPHNNPNARGTFIGMTLNTSRWDMTQAVLEGVAFAFRDCLEIARQSGIQVTRTKICGGGANSPLWINILANVLNVKVDILENEHGPSLGAAILAMVAAGTYANVKEATDNIVKVVNTITPDEALVHDYQRCYETFRQLYPACKGAYDILQ